MHRGLLSDYFTGVAVKRLAAVDADPSSSNQHEVTGSRTLLALLGDKDRKGDHAFSATYIWLGGEQEGLTDEGSLSWYDSRRGQPHRTPEWRLYYQRNPVTRLMRPGDFLFVAVRGGDHLLFVVTSPESTFQSQLSWLFGLPDEPDFEFIPQEISAGNSSALDFASRYILDELQVELEEPDFDPLDSLIERFGLKFPTTREFSMLARMSLRDVSGLDAPDDSLLSWVEREEQLFRRLERKVVSERLRSGFLTEDEVDVDGFIQFSLSVQNRRKSRAGAGLEHHLEALFSLHDLRFERNAETENGNRPDFLFPGQKFYQDQFFQAGGLTMLGSKSSLKDRWRQVLSEALRIEAKHLFTLEPAVSINQTAEMRAKNLQLVVPKRLHFTYHRDQRDWLFSLEDFLAVVRERQRRLSGSTPSVSGRAK
jgi:EcoRII C terminal